jgi:predicted nucleic acid-binding protein
MLVVADSSPLIALINIGEVGLLGTLFGPVYVPRDVADELRADRRPQIVRSFMIASPDWFIERTPGEIEAIPNLHAGEIAAISLARELKADLLLIDEAEGRRAAAARGLAITGTVGVLERAAEQKLLDLGSAFERLKATGFWISHRLLDERLVMFQSRSRE